MANFPIEIFTIVLSMLPVKSLLRLKCVCKSWCSLIKSPKFIKLHLNQTLISDSDRHLLLSYSFAYHGDPDFRHNHLSFSEFNLHQKQNHLVFSELNNPLKPREISYVGSCNGVVCISDNSKNDIFLFNPLTKSQRKLPPRHISIHGNNTSLVLGFGHDAENDDYKVLRLIQDGNINGFTYNKTEIYSLKNNSWKCVEGIPYVIMYAPRPGIFVNGALHYIVATMELQFNLIASFDFKTETYSLVDCPKYDDDQSRSNVEVDVGELGGCLCILVNYPTAILVDHRLDRVDLWLMKEYGKKESWVRLFSIREPASIGIFLQIRMVAHSQDQSRILLEADCSQLGWYDLETKIFERFTGLPLPPMFSSVFVGSLVSLGDDKVQSEGGTILPMPRKNTKKNNMGNFLSKGFKLRL